MGHFGTCVGSPPEGRALLCDLEARVAGGSVCDLPGCPMKLDIFVPLLKVVKWSKIMYVYHVLFASPPNF